MDVTKSLDVSLFFDALRLLTRLPVRSKLIAPGRSAIFFPIVGAMLGAAGAAIYIEASPFLPSWLAALLVVAFWAAIERTPVSFAIALSAIARWLALDYLVSDRVWEIFIAAQAVPRAAMVALAWVSRPATGGLGLAFCSTLGSAAALGAIAQGVVAALICGVRPGVAIIAGTYLAIRGVQWRSYSRAGGIGAGSLVLIEQIMQIYILFLFTFDWR